MGAFRDFFEGIWKTYIGDKLDSVIAKIKDEIGDRLTGLSESVVGISTFLDTKIGLPIKTAIGNVETKLGDIKDGIADIPSKIGDSIDKLKDIYDILSSIDEFFEGGKEHSPGFWSELYAHFTGFNKYRYLHMIHYAESVEALDLLYNHLDDKYRNDTEIKDAYNSRRAELEAQGLNKYSDTHLGMFGKGVQMGVKAITDAALNNLSPIFEDFMKERNIPESDREKIRAIAGSGEFGLNAVVSFMLGNFLSPVISTSLSPVWEGLAQDTWYEVPIRLEDPATLIRLKYKGLISDDYFEDHMRKQGYGNDARRSMLNDFIWMPTVRDIIVWAVREAFYDDYSAQYGLDNEYPEKLDEYGPKLAISSNELKYFWRSHWELPSILQGYEMLHRGVITSEDLDNLFMAADILPWWRDKLKAISYAPYTRVDVRRLFRDGVIDRDTVKRNYLDLGYDEEHAENLTTWTVQDTLSKERDLTRSQIEKLYKEGQITRETATTNLVSLGYDEEEAGLILTLVDIKIQDEIDNDLIATWLDQFKLHIINLDALESNLKTLNLTVEKTNRILAKAQRIEAKFISLPSKEDLSRWLKKGIITKDVYTTRMLGLGYSDTDIAYYIKDITGGEE